MSNELNAFSDLAPAYGSYQSSLAVPQQTVASENQPSLEELIAQDKQRFSPGTEDARFEAAKAARSNLTDQGIAEKFGLDSLYSLKEYDKQMADITLARLGTRENNAFQTLGNTVKNTAGTIARDLAETASFIASAPTLFKDNAVSNLFGDVAQGIENVTDSMGSAAEKADRALFNALQARSKASNIRQYRDDKANGASDAEAALSYVGRETAYTSSNAFGSGYSSEVFQKGIGSIASAALTGKAVVGTLAKIPAVTKATSLIDAEVKKGSSIAKALKRGGEYAVGEGLLEGSSTGNEIARDILETPYNKLEETSPLYKEYLKDHLNKGEKEEEAKENARRDLAQFARFKVGTETAITSGISQAIVGSPFKAFKGGKTTTGKATSKAFDVVKEPSEEYVQEGTGQWNQNRFTKNYVDSSKNVAEGIGESAALSTVGGLTGSATSTANLAGLTAAKGKQAISEARQKAEIKKANTAVEQANKETGVNLSFTPEQQKAHNFKEDASYGDNFVSLAKETKEAIDNIFDSEGNFNKDSYSRAGNNLRTLIAQEDQLTSAANQYVSEINEEASKENPDNKKINALKEKVNNLQKLGQSLESLYNDFNKAREKKSSKKEEAPIISEAQEHFRKIANDSATEEELSKPVLQRLADDIKNDLTTQQRDFLKTYIDLIDQFDTSLDKVDITEEAKDVASRSIVNNDKDDKRRTTTGIVVKGNSLKEHMQNIAIHIQANNAKGVEQSIKPLQGLYQSKLNKLKALNKAYSDINNKKDDPNAWNEGKYYFDYQAINPANQQEFLRQAYVEPGKHNKFAASIEREANAIYRVLNSIHKAYPNTPEPGNVIKFDHYSPKYQNDYRNVLGLNIPKAESNKVTKPADVSTEDKKEEQKQVEVETTSSEDQEKFVKNIFKNQLKELRKKKINDFSDDQIDLQASILAKGTASLAARAKVNITDILPKIKGRKTKDKNALYQVTLPSELLPKNTKLTDRLVTINKTRIKAIPQILKEDFVMPSLGITKQKSVYKGFGECVFIGSADLINPEKDPTYSTDAYTVRHPYVSHYDDKKVVWIPSDISNKAWEYINKHSDLKSDGYDGWYLPYSKENVFLIMSAQAGINKEFNTDSLEWHRGTLLAQSATKFKSLDEVKKNRFKILDSDSVKEESNDMDILLNSIKRFNSFYRFNITPEFFLNLVKETKNLPLTDLENKVQQSIEKYISDLKNKLKYSDWSIDKEDFKILEKELNQRKNKEFITELTEDLITLVNLFNNAHTDYFEAKPERIIKVEDFVGVMLPDIPLISNRVIKAFEDKQLQVYLYDPKRFQEAFEEFTDELQKEGRNVLYQRSNKQINGMFNSEKNTISLTPNADLSTFAHEHSHWYLDTLMTLASNPEATQEIKNEAQDVLKVLGIANIEAWNALNKAEYTKQHEKFASWAEQYLAEGIVPDASLKEVFKKFAQFLKSIYETLTGKNAKEAIADRYKDQFSEDLPELSDEVKAALERMYTGKIIVTSKTSEKVIKDSLKAPEELKEGEEEPQNLEETKKNILASFANLATGFLNKFFKVRTSGKYIASRIADKNILESNFIASLKEGNLAKIIDFLGSSTDTTNLLLKTCSKETLDVYARQLDPNNQASFINKIEDKVIKNIKEKLKTDDWQKLLKQENPILEPNQKLLAICNKDGTVNRELLRKASLAMFQTILDTRGTNTTLEKAIEDGEISDSVSYNESIKKAIKEDPLLPTLINKLEKDPDNKNLKQAYQERLSLIKSLPLTGIPVGSIQASMSRRILQYWGITPDRKAKSGNSKAIADALAAEFLYHLEDRESIIPGITFNEGIYRSPGMSVLSSITYWRDGKQHKYYRNNFYTALSDAEINRKYANRGFVKNTRKYLKQEPKLLDKLFLVEDEHPIFSTNVDGKITYTDNIKPKTNILHKAFRISSKQEKAALIRNQTEYKLNTDFATYLQDKVTIDTLISWLNAEVEDSPDNYNLADWESKQSKKESIIRSWNEVFNDVAQMKAYAEQQGKDISEVSRHYLHAYQANSRLQQQGTSAPQTNKIAREVFMSSGSTLDLTDPNQRRFYILGVMQGMEPMGCKIHRTFFSNDHVANNVLTTEETFDKLLSQSSFVKLVDHIKSGESLNRDLLNECLADKELDMARSMASLYCLTDLAKILKKENGKYVLDESKIKNHHTFVYVELDGVTNGFSNAEQIWNNDLIVRQFLCTSAKGGNAFNNPEGIGSLASLIKKDNKTNEKAEASTDVYNSIKTGVDTLFKQWINGTYAYNGKDIAEKKPKYMPKCAGSLTLLTLGIQDKTLNEQAIKGINDYISDSANEHDLNEANKAITSTKFIVDFSRQVFKDATVPVNYGVGVESTADNFMNGILKDHRTKLSAAIRRAKRIDPKYIGAGKNQINPRTFYFVTDDQIQDYLDNKISAEELNKSIYIKGSTFKKYFKEFYASSFVLQQGFKKDLDAIYEQGIKDSEKAWNSFLPNSIELMQTESLDPYYFKVLRNGAKETFAKAVMDTAKKLLGDVFDNTSLVNSANVIAQTLYRAKFISKFQEKFGKINPNEGLSQEDIDGFIDELAESIPMLKTDSQNILAMKTTMWEYFNDGSGRKLTAANLNFNPKDPDLSHAVLSTDSIDLASNNPGVAAKAMFTIGLGDAFMMMDYAFSETVHHSLNTFDGSQTGLSVLDQANKEINTSVAKSYDQNNFKYVKELLERVIYSLDPDPRNQAKAIKEVLIKLYEQDQDPDAILRLLNSAIGQNNPKALPKYIDKKTPIKEVIFDLIEDLSYIIAAESSWNDARSIDSFDSVIKQYPVNFNKPLRALIREAEWKKEAFLNTKKKFRFTTDQMASTENPYDNGVAYKSDEELKEIIKTDPSYKLDGSETSEDLFVSAFNIEYEKELAALASKYEQPQETTEDAYTIISEARISSPLAKHLVKNGFLKKDQIKVIRNSIQAFMQERTGQEISSNTTGIYDPNTKTIMLAPNTGSESLDHEIIHALTFDKVSQFYGKNAENNRTKFKNTWAAVRALEMLANRFTSLDPEENETISKVQNVVKSYLAQGNTPAAINEFMAYGLTESAVIERLRKEHSPSDTEFSKRVLSRFKQLIERSKSTLKAFFKRAFGYDMSEEELNGYSDWSKLTIATEQILNERGLEESTNEIQRNILARLADTEDTTSKPFLDFCRQFIIPGIKDSKVKINDENLGNFLKRTTSKVGDTFQLSANQRENFNLALNTFLTIREAAPNDFQELTEHFHHSLDSINPDNLVPSDEKNFTERDAKANTRMEFLKGLGVDSTTNKMMPAIFFALSVSCPEMQNALINVKPKTISETQSEHLVDRWLEQSGKWLLMKIGGFFMGGSYKRPKNVQDALNKMQARLIKQYESTTSESIGSTINNISVAAGDVADKYSSKYVKKLADLISDKVLLANLLDDLKDIRDYLDKESKANNLELIIKGQEPRGTFLKSLKYTFKAGKFHFFLLFKLLSSKEDKESVFEAWRIFAYLTKNDWTISLERDIEGITGESYEVYRHQKRMKSRVQKVRNMYIQGFPKLLRKDFKENLNTEQYSKITRSLFKTDLLSISENHKLDEITLFLKDPTALENEIKANEEHIAKFSYETQAIIKDCKDLAEFMMTGRTKSGTLKKNSAAIAFRYGTNHNYSETELNKREEMRVPIDRLTSFYALQYISEEERAEVAKLINNNREGVESVMGAYDDCWDKSSNSAITRSQLSEAQRDRSTIGIANGLKGYLPKYAKKHTKMIIVDRANMQDYLDLGWKIQEEYSNNFEKNKVILTLSFNNQPGYNEGMLSIVEPTVLGNHPTRGYSLSNPGGFVPAKFINTKAIPENSPVSYIPVYSANGSSIIGYERIIKNQEMLEGNYEEDITEILGRWKGRLIEEDAADSTLEPIVTELKNLYFKSSDMAKKTFIDILDPEVVKTLDPVMQDAINNLPSHLIDTVGNIWFTEENSELVGQVRIPHLYIRRDMFDDVVGIRQASIVDFLTGNTRWSPQVQGVVSKLIISFFGSKAKAYESLMKTEAGWKKIVSIAKTSIVVRSFVVMRDNILANMLDLMLMGVPLTKQLVLIPKMLYQIEQYNQNGKKLADLEKKRDKYPKGTTQWEAVNNRMEQLHQANQELSLIKPMIDADEFSVVENLDAHKEDFEMLENLPWALDDKATEAWDKLPAGLKETLRQGTISKDTAMFSLLNKGVQYGDFIAKCILYQRYLEEGSSEQEAKVKVRDHFVDYDRSMGRDRQYLESIGLLWFYNYKIRILKTALEIATDHPARAAIILFLVNGKIPNPFSDSLFGKMGALTYSMGPSHAISGLNENMYLNAANALIN